MASKRTRTGCKTCRSRKLKCDEARPICTQCQKSNRQCIPSDGIAFRHSQNAGLNAVGGGLDNFYKYRQTFTPDQYFVPIPGELRFVHVTDPYEDDPNAQSSTDYQHLAAHSLEALSTAAAGNPPPILRPNTYNEYTGGYTQSGGRPASSGQIQSIHEHNDLHFLLNPSSHTPSALIDPNLEAPGEQQSGSAMREMTEAHNMKDDGQADAHADDDNKLDVSHFDRQVLAALQNSGDSTIEGVM